MPDGEQRAAEARAACRAGAGPGTTAGPAQDWPAPAAAGPVHAVVPLPGSKSITNRALVLAALADGPGLIKRPLRARDTLLMAAALRALGAGIEEEYASTDGTPVPCWRVTPCPRSAGAPGVRAVDVGNAGTVLRFVPPVAALTLGRVAFDGDPRARERPVGPLLGALRELGVVIDDDGRGALPFTVAGRGYVPGRAVTLDASGSSQLVSALLLAGARFDKGVEVHHQGPPVPSSPHVAMTIGMLRDAGVRVEATGPDSWRVHPGPLRAGSVDVEPDLSNAAPFLAAALVTGGTVTIPGWPARTTQPGDVLRDLLARMGGNCKLTAAGLTVRGSGPIHGIAADLRDVTELVPVLTALAALASSPSRFTGIAHMRLHETDRIAALAREINALGGQVSELPGGLVITPRPLRAAGAAGPAGAGSTGGARAGRAFATYDDHRLVMAAAVLGLAVPGLRVANAATVGKTLPGFTQLWAQMLESVP
ncbi:MAG TPA: 3-phosphoshikimate 1-carboxyvinyltransferase [Streptosporangiaceae bacterium]|nr:3-phosphoshikimate 1-carboxyvinyltransferase [Streptosporangiaceae bacterium]